MLTATIVTAFAGWFLLSAVTQIRLPSVRRIRVVDWLGVLPRWNFFAPHPIVGDLVVQYRAWSPDSAGEWCDAPWLTRHRWRDPVWPAGRRARKATFENAAALAALYRAHADRPSAVIRSVPYLLLLARVSRELPSAPTPPTGPAQAVQFRVLQVAYDRRGAHHVVLVRSGTHAVDGAPC